MAELARKNSSNLQEFMDRAEEFMNTKDTIRALTESNRKKEALPRRREREAEKTRRKKGVLQKI